MHTVYYHKMHTNIIKCHMLSLLNTLPCTQTQINTATSSLKCTSPPCFPLSGFVPVRTVAQNSQSVGSAGDSLSDSNNFPAWLEMCLLYLYHYAALAASFTTTKQKLQQSCSYSVWALCKFCLQLSLGCMLMCIHLCVAVCRCICNFPDRK